jgi:hypothetical protein
MGDLYSVITGDSGGAAPPPDGVVLQANSLLSKLRLFPDDEPVDEGDFVLVLDAVGVMGGEVTLLT